MNKDHRQGIYVWLMAVLLSSGLLLILSVFLLIVSNGIAAFWPSPIAHFVLFNKSEIIGIKIDSEYTNGYRRYKIQRGGVDAGSPDYIWVAEYEVSSESYPEPLMLIEQIEGGDVIGFPIALVQGEDSIGANDDRFSRRLEAALHDAKQVRDDIQTMRYDDLHPLLRKKVRLLRQLESTPEGPGQVRLESLLREAENQYTAVQEQIDAMVASVSSGIQIQGEHGDDRMISLFDVQAVSQPNKSSLIDKVLVLLSRFLAFLIEDPQEANMEGGIFPALMGTVVLVILMSAIVSPLGVLTAIYLHEYAKPGVFVSMIRIAIHNLAGIPSIVFGVFGLGFFVYGIGGGIDELFFSDRLPRPTFGTGGVLWASLTLALLTLPTVIVATEEGLAAIPKHFRDAAYALGATRVEMVFRVIVPSLLPSMLTGMVLAVARAAGEVAPLMLTGVVKLAPAMAVDGVFPYVHLQRKFMHLGYHIYDLGFQSPNVDAARPQIYATTLILILLVVILNVSAVIIRKRLRDRLGEGSYL